MQVTLQFIYLAYSDHRQLKTDLVHTHSQVGIPLDTRQ